MEAIETVPPLASLKPFSKDKSKLKDLPSVTVKWGNVKVEIDGGWLSMCTMWPDILMTSYIGYWARGVERTDELGWLLWEVEDDDRIRAFLDKHNCTYVNQLNKKEEDEFHREALKAWKAGKPLPKYYHRLDREAAVRGYLAMLTRKTNLMVPGGFDWFENADANSYDVAVQLALFNGEVKYG